jgi:hypothetical protein
MVGAKRRPGRMALDAAHGPVVKPRALQIPVVQAEAQRLDQVQRRAGGRACPGDVAGILRDFRADQHHVHHLSPSSSTT